MSLQPDVGSLVNHFNASQECQRQTQIIIRAANELRDCAHRLWETIYRGETATKRKYHDDLNALKAAIEAYDKSKLVDYE